MSTAKATTDKFEEIKKEREVERAKLRFCQCCRRERYSRKFFQIKKEKQRKKERTEYIQKFCCTDDGCTYSRPCIVYLN